MIDDINDAINNPQEILTFPISDPDFTTVLENHFDDGQGGFNFDIGNEDHRTILGLELQNILDQRVDEGGAEGFSTDQRENLP